MNSQNVLTLFVLVGLLIVLTFSDGTAQSMFGGPYEVDEHTVLLLHFDENLENASDYTEDAVGRGDLSYVWSPLGRGMGSCLHLNNETPDKRSYVRVADSRYLDLAGSWTIEGWVKFNSIGYPGDHNWVPRLVMKRGEYWWQPNYFVEAWGHQAGYCMHFSTGYFDGDEWPLVNSPSNFIELGKWYHVTFIRDPSLHVIAQIIRDIGRNILSVSWYEYDPYT